MYKRQGATPIGSYYTAILHLSDGTTSRQYWVIPIAIPGGGPAKLAAIQNQVLPTSVAMQLSLIHISIEEPDYDVSVLKVKSGNVMKRERTIHGNMDTLLT